MAHASGHWIPRYRMCVVVAMVADLANLRRDDFDFTRRTRIAGAAVASAVRLQSVDAVGLAAAILTDCAMQWSLHTAIVALPLLAAFTNAIREKFTGDSDGATVAMRLVRALSCNHGVTRGPLITLSTRANTSAGVGVERHACGVRHGAMLSNRALGRRLGLRLSTRASDPTLFARASASIVAVPVPCDRTRMGMPAAIVFDRAYFQAATGPTVRGRASAGAPRRRPRAQAVGLLRALRATAVLLDGADL